METIPISYCSQCGVQINDGEDLLAGGFYKFLDERDGTESEIVTCYDQKCHDAIESILNPDIQSLV